MKPNRDLEVVAAPVLLEEDAVRSDYHSVAEPRSIDTAARSYAGPIGHIYIAAVCEKGARAYVNVSSRLGEKLPAQEAPDPGTKPATGEAEIRKVLGESVVEQQGDPTSHSGKE
jgi:hypothetical protein